MVSMLTNNGSPLSLPCSQNKVVVAGLTSGEMDSFLQIAELLFAGVILDDELACWSLHVDIVQQLEASSYSVDDLTTLMAMIILFKSAMVRLYADVRDLAGKLLSVIFPNLELASHWPDQIRFLGPPWCQDTKLWEQCHLPARVTLTRMNQRFCERDVLGKVSYSFPICDCAGPTLILCVHRPTQTMRSSGMLSMLVTQGHLSSLLETTLQCPTPSQVVVWLCQTSLTIASASSPTPTAVSSPPRTTSEAETR